MENLSAQDSLAALKAQREGCGGICKNGGQCQNGECVCREGFEGDFCDEEAEGVAAELIWYFFITVVLVIAVVLFFKGKEVKKLTEDYLAQRRLNEQAVADRNH